MSWKTLKGIRRFTPGEFPEDPEEHADPGLIYSLDNFAVALAAPVYPSPVPGALARFDGSKTSRHFAVGSRSDAVDLGSDGLNIRVKAVTPREIQDRFDVEVGGGR